MSSPPSVLKLLPAKLESAAAQPFYAAIHKSLLLAIQQDQHAVGKTLPIEREIAEHFGVSRLTIRQAIELLEREGFVAKRRGKPTEITRNTPRPTSERMLGRLSDILSSSTLSESRVLAYTRLQSAPAAQLLQLPDDAWLYCLKLEQHGEPGKIGITEVYLPDVIGKKLTREQFEEAALHGTLFVFPLVEREAGVRVERARVTVGASDLLQIGDHEVAKLMGHHPLVRLQFVFYSTQQPFQLTINWFDSRFYSVTYELDR